MKKIITAISAFLIFAALAGCGAKDDTAAKLKKDIEEFNKSHNQAVLDYNYEGPNQNTSTSPFTSER